MKKYTSLEKQEARTALFFVAPFILGLLIFSIIPIIYSFYISFINFNSLAGFRNSKFVGFANYIDVFTDPDMVMSFVKSFYYMAVYVPVIIIVSLALAMAIDRKFKLRTTTRTMILIPYMSNTIAISIVWAVMLNPYDGIVNTLLKHIGFANPPMWLASPRTSLITVALIAAWQNLAFQTIVFLAALQEVPLELYESAEIDGANRWLKFTQITLPYISPTTFFLIVASIIGSTQNFAIVKALTNGGPGNSSEVISVNIYKTAFEFNKYSLAASQAIILFLILIVITIMQWKGQKKWVHY